jgi:PST family polysaccharide transporter
MGLGLSGFSATDFVARNGDRVAIGRGLGAQTLGYYQNAMFVYDNLLEVLVSPLHQVAVASLSKLRSNLDALKSAWTKALSTVAFYTMPVFGVIAIIGHDLILVLLGQKWVPAGDILGLLALRGMAHSVERTLGWLHVAAGRTDRWFRWGILSTTVQLGAVICALPFGPMGVVSALVITMYLLFVPSLAYAGRPLGIHAGDVIRATGIQLAGALATALLGFGVRFWLLADVHPIQRIVILTLLYVTTYLILVVGIGRVRTPLEICLSLVRDVAPVRLKPMLAFGAAESSSTAARPR